MTQYIEDIKLGFNNQKEEASASLKALFEHIEPEFEQLRTKLEALDCPVDSHKYREPSLTFSS